MKKITFLLLIISIFSFSVFAQEKTVTGIVTYESGETVPSLVIQVAGRNNATITDTDGKYSIKVQESDSLVFKCIRKETQTIAVAGKTRIDVILKNSEQEIEVVTLEKEIVHAGMDDIRISDYSALNALQGKTCGVNISISNDEPVNNTEEYSQINDNEFKDVINNTEKEAEKVFVKDLRANMFTIAKDVKIQIEFNPVHVKAYRLIGYVNRILEDEDFDDDTKDAGELGAGHTVTALYEIIPTNTNEEVRQHGDLKYQVKTTTELATSSKEIMTLKLRYKPIDADKSILLEQIISKKDIISADKTSDNFKFSASVAAFGMLLRESVFIENYSYDDVLKLAEKSHNKDDEYQKEFIDLIKKAKSISD